MRRIFSQYARTALLIFIAFAFCAALSSAQRERQLDPSEPAQPHTPPAVLPRPVGGIFRSEIDDARMRALVEALVACKTRNSLSSWTDTSRGAGCGRDAVLARMNESAGTSDGKLQVTVDKFETSSPRTSNQPVHMENIYAILPGSDPVLSKTIFIVSGHFDSRATDVMDPNIDAPGADDDASGASVSVECARLLTRSGIVGRGPYRATLIFASVSGEEQGLLGSAHMVEWAKQQGYTVGGMLDDDIVGADAGTSYEHRVRLFSGGGAAAEGDSPSRELARAIEEIDGVANIRLIFDIDRLGRAGDHYPFWKAGLPSVRFTEPLEDYRHQHQTVRVESGVYYGDELKYLNYKFMGNVARDNAEALRQLAMAPAPPADVTLSGGVTPDARLNWTASDDAGRAGFEILWRETTNPRWQVYDLVPSGTQTTLTGVSTDNHYFAVRAVGKNGARSISVPAQTGGRGPNVSPTVPKS